MLHLNQWLDVRLVLKAKELAVKCGSHHITSIKLRDTLKVAEGDDCLQFTIDTGLDQLTFRASNKVQMR